MKRKRSYPSKKKLLVSFLIIILVTSINFSSDKKRSITLPIKYKKWLEEIVIYIITSTEKKIFLQLETDRERDLFIESFWKHRDPNPLTEKNEFKDEHYRKIEYANRYFGRLSPLLGWKTDRGRIYITLGPPTSIRTYENYSLIYPTVVWSYQGMSKYGLPDAFNIVFFRKRGTGDYRQYSPSMDGPESLLPQYSLGTRSSAYAALKTEAPSLAEASLSLIPGESVMSEYLSTASDRLLLDINSAPQKIVKDEYAEKFFKYRDTVEVEYSANYIGNESIVQVIKNEFGISFVHYSVELDKFSVSLYEDKYFTELTINGSISDLDGNIIYQFKRVIPIKLDQKQFILIKAQKCSFQDIFPLVEGNYRFNLLIKNEASKEFSSVEKEINTPPSSSLQISKLVLCYKREKVSSSEKIKAFRIGNIQLFPSSLNYFTCNDKLILFFQIFGLSKELKKRGFLKYTFFKDEEKFQSEKKELKDYESTNFFVKEFPLTDFPPAHYEMRVSLFDGAGKEVLFEKSYFSITPVSSLPRPWINSIVHHSFGDPIYSFILGEQQFNKREYDKAKIFFEKAYRHNPASLQFALGFSNVLFALKKYEDIIEILMPFLIEKNYQVLLLLSRAYHNLDYFDKAIFHYREHISHYGSNYFVLRLLGNCYYQIGNIEEALKAFERSLELNPKQEKLKELVNSIKKRKTKNKTHFF